MCLAKSHGMGQQQQQRAMLTGVVYANAAAQLMKMISVSSARQVTNSAEIDLTSSLYHDYVSLHFYQGAPQKSHASLDSHPLPAPNLCHRAATAPVQIDLPPQRAQAAGPAVSAGL